MPFVCNLCGESWQKHPATQVACPQCKAAVGSPCKRPSGHTLMYGEVHIAREQVAVDAGLLSKTCPAMPTVPAPLPPATRRKSKQVTRPATKTSTTLPDAKQLLLF